jgi:hypothetical protein
MRGRMYCCPGRCPLVAGLSVSGIGLPAFVGTPWVRVAEPAVEFIPVTRSVLTAQFSSNLPRSPLPPAVLAIKIQLLSVTT